MKNNFKKKLHEHCISLVQQKIIAIQQSIKTSQDSANSDGKSSAGDKYETSRAMSHNEIEWLSRQLSDAQKEFSLLQSFNPEKKSEKISAGCIAVSELGKFYISVALGNIIFEKEDIKVISPSSPIAQQMLGKKENENFIFNGKKVLIDEIL